MSKLYKVTYKKDFPGPVRAKFGNFLFDRRQEDEGEMDSRVKKLSLGGVQLESLTRDYADRFAVEEISEERAFHKSTKDKLKDQAAEMGLDTSGTKDEIIARIQEAGGSPPGVEG